MSPTCWSRWLYLPATFHLQPVPAAFAHYFLECCPATHSGMLQPCPGGSRALMTGNFGMEEESIQIVAASYWAGGPQILFTTVDFLVIVRICPNQKLIVAFFNFAYIIVSSIGQNPARPMRPFPSNPLHPCSHHALLTPLCPCLFS